MTGTGSAVATLASWMSSCDRTVFFTGAGMSTESGLPDFRSAGGLWRRNRRFEELASLEALATAWEEFVEFYRWRIERLAVCAPHSGHHRIAAWQRERRVGALITQNVDGFHEQAGSHDAIRLHGTLRRIHCARCGLDRPSEEFLRDAGLVCARCGGRMRPSVVLLGEALPAEALGRAREASERARLFVVLGSSLLVSPANWFPQVAKQAGARLVLVNHEPTPLSSIADLEIRASIRDVLEVLARELPAAQAPRPGQNS